MKDWLWWESLNGVMINKYVILLLCGDKLNFSPWQHVGSTDMTLIACRDMTLAVKSGIKP